MDQQPRGRFVAKHVQSIAARTESETDRLVSAMRRRCWPGAASDRTDPSALEWVRRWGPWLLGPSPPGCSCARGRCRVCN